MHGNLPAQAQRAIFEIPKNPNDEKQPGKNSDYSEFSIKRLAAALFPPKKAASHLEFLAGESLGTWYDRLQNDRDPPAGSLVRLLRSREGGRVYAFIMRGCKAEHWQQHQLAEICLAAKLGYDAAIAEGAKQLEMQL